MRISCDAVADFFENLVGNKVYQQTVFVQKLSMILNGRTKADATSFEIGLQVSAIVEYQDGGQALMEAAEVCGIDRLTTDGGLEGTERQTKLIRAIQAKCDALGLQVRPGTLDL